MQASKLNLIITGYNHSFRTKKERSHYKWLMSQGSVFPTTKAQAKHYISSCCVIGMLNADDVVMLEDFLNKHGFTGDYRYTKSKKWVRLENQHDLISALKCEYNL